MKSRGRKQKRIKSLLGDISFNRSVFKCPSCNETRIPGDETLDIPKTGYSPGTRRLMSRAGGRGTFKEGRDDLKIYAEINVTAKDVERISEGVGEEMDEWQKKEREELIADIPRIAPRKEMPLMYISYDGTGVPMVPCEVKGRKGKQEDGTARTREAKLGCVFTQTTVDDGGRPVRDDESTTFVGAIETAEEFGWRIYGEALRRGVEKAETAVVIGDGAKWVWGIAETHFPSAIQIVDLYHAREHVYELCHIIAAGDDKTRVRNQLRWLTCLDNGDVEKMVQEAESQVPKRGKRRKACLTAIGYFTNNAHRMKYAEFRERGFFVGSGVVEAGCKSLIGMRLKRSGMEWSVDGANSIISLRCCHVSGRTEDFWEERVG